jgi:hypothetical protein
MTELLLNSLENFEKAIEDLIVKAQSAGFSDEDLVSILDKISNHLEEDDDDDFDDEDDDFDDEDDDDFDDDFDDEEDNDDDFFDDEE